MMVLRTCWSQIDLQMNVISYFALAIYRTQTDDQRVDINTEDGECKSHLSALCWVLS